MKKLSFFGGTGMVTGACYRLETDDVRILVDCGLIQGGRFAESMNGEPFAFNASELQYVFVTHAHADHIGRLPKLYREGFRGKIISTAPTRDLTEVMLHDSLKMMTREKERHGSGFVFTETELAQTMNLFETHPYNETLRLSPSTRAYLRDSAHILGSAMVEVHSDDMIIVFTGDLGNPPTPFLNEPYPIERCDYMVMESVYGDRFHEDHAERKTILERAIEDAVTAGGTIIIPSFALERTQVMLAELDELITHNRVPRIPVFLDSPLAIKTTEVYKKYEHLFNTQAQRIIKSGDDFFNFPGLRFTPSREDSQAINNVPPPKIIMAGNPHGYGSRIAYHFIRCLPDPRSTILFVGYPRISSLGRALMDNAREVEIFNKRIPVRAKILNISGYSAHADQRQLKSFVASIKKPIGNIFVAMGERQSSETLARVLRDEVGVHTTVPKLGDVIDLE